MKAIVMDEWDYDLVRKTIEIGRIFIEETEFPLTFNYQKIYERLSTAYFSPHGDIILVLGDDGEVMGGAVVYAIADWHDEVFGYVEKCFIRPERRGVGAGRLMAEKMAEWFDARECLFSFVTSTANIGATRQFNNLMAKYGYSDLGPTLAREYQHGKICTKST